MILFKEITLHPTTQKLHIWVGKDINKLTELLQHKYKNAIKNGTWGHSEIISGNELHRFYDKDKFMLVLTIDDFSPSVIVHELIHIIDRVSERYGLQTDVNSTEWRAYFAEMIFSMIVDKKGYTKIK